ncbi:MAG: O-antigen ligase family protein [Rhodospirillales bacterium]|nr:O-antigen ligase family protein [Rhodospirillales bacterium]
MTNDKATDLAGWERAAEGKPWVLTAGALICALGLLLGRWSPARLMDYQAWDDVPWFLDVRLPLVIAGLLIIAMIRDGRPAAPRLPPQLTLGVTFIILALLTFTATSGIGGIDCHTAYCGDKALDVIWLACFLFITFFLALEPGFEDRFFICVFVLCMLLALMGLRGALQTVTPGATGLTVMQGGRNVFSRLLGVLAILALYYYLGARQNTLRLGMLGIFGLSLALLVLTGSRGGTAASLLGLGAAAVLFRAPLRGVLVIGLAVVVAGAIAVESGVLDTFARYVSDRYINRVFGQLYLSGRDTLMKDGIQMWMDYPLMGAGLGRFSEYNALSYPHNFFIELLAETGVVGFAMLLMPLGFVLDVVRRYWDATDKRAIAIFALYLAAAQASGDLYDSRALLLMPVVAACGAVARQGRAAAPAPRPEQSAESMA